MSTSLHTFALVLMQTILTNSFHPPLLPIQEPPRLAPPIMGPDPDLQLRGNRNHHVHSKNHRPRRVRYNKPSRRLDRPGMLHWDCRGVLEVEGIGLVDTNNTSKSGESEGGSNRGSIVAGSGTGTGTGTGTNGYDAGVENWQTEGAKGFI